MCNKHNSRPSLTRHHRRCRHDGRRQTQRRPASPTSNSTTPRVFPTEVVHLDVAVDLWHRHRSILFLNHDEAANHSFKMRISTSDESSSAIRNRKIEKMIATNTKKARALIRCGVYSAWPSALCASVPLTALFCGALGPVLSCLFETNGTDKDSLSCVWCLCFCFPFCVYVYVCWWCRCTP